MGRRNTLILLERWSVSHEVSFAQTCVTPQASDNINAYATHKRNSLVLLSTYWHIVIAQ